MYKSQIAFLTSIYYFFTIDVLEPARKTLCVLIRRALTQNKLAHFLATSDVAKSVCLLVRAKPSFEFLHASGKFASFFPSSAAAEAFYNAVERSKSGELPINAVIAARDAALAATEGGAMVIEPMQIAVPQASF
jgi:hypothetical protein